MIEVGHVIQWILSVFSILISGLVGIVVKMLWDTIKGIQKENERLATRINALEVNIVKISHISEDLKEIKDFQKEHLALHRHIDSKWDTDRLETEKLRSTWIPRIQNLEGFYKEILAELKKMSSRTK